MRGMPEPEIDETPARSLPDSLWREVQNEYARATRSGLNEQTVSDMMHKSYQGIPKDEEFTPQNVRRELIRLATFALYGAERLAR